MSRRVYARTKHILLPKDYIRYRMTGEYATEVSDASGTLLLDVVNRVWSDKLLALLQIDTALLPSVHESPEVTGKLHADGRGGTGPARGHPSGRRRRATRPPARSGTESSRRASSAPPLAPAAWFSPTASSPTRDPQGRVHTMCHAVPGKWCVFGCMLSAGGSFQWFRNQLGAEEVAAAKKAERRSV